MLYLFSVSLSNKATRQIQLNIGKKLTQSFLHSYSFLLTCSHPSSPTSKHLPDRQQSKQKTSTKQTHGPIPPPPNKFHYTHAPVLQSFSPLLYKINLSCLNHFYVYICIHMYTAHANKGLEVQHCVLSYWQLKLSESACNF